VRARPAAAQVPRAIASTTAMNLDDGNIAINLRERKTQTRRRKGPRPFRLHRQALVVRFVGLLLVGRRSRLTHGRWRRCGRYRRRLAVIARGPLLRSVAAIAGVNRIVDGALGGGLFSHGARGRSRRNNYRRGLNDDLGRWRRNVGDFFLARTASRDSKKSDNTHRTHG